MTRARAVVALAVLLVVPLPAAASDLDLRIGASFPSADSSLFNDNEELYGFSPNHPVEDSDWIGVYGGAEWRFRVAPSFYLGIHLDGYGRSLDTEYLDFERPGGAPIFQTLKLSILPLGASIRWVPKDGRHDISPYFGAGVDAVFYQYEEFGDFIDFFSDNLDIRPDSFESDGAAFGGHAAVGLRIPIGHDFAITAEGRYQFAQRKRMEEDFDQNIIDVNGASATIGIRLRF